MRHQSKLDEGKIEKLVLFLRAIDSSNPERADKIRTEANYFENNAERMRYPQFRSQHLFVGTGVIEAGCKTVIGSRLKQSGMFWTVRGANSIIALRCARLVADSRTTGRRVGLDSHSYVAHPELEENQELLF